MPRSASADASSRSATRFNAPSGSPAASARAAAVISAAGREIGGFNMKVLELQPATRVLWQVVDGPAEWIGTTISFDLRQEGEYCIVMFQHQGWREPVEFMHHCSTKWAIFLMSLKSL